MITTDEREEAMSDESKRVPREMWMSWNTDGGYCAVRDEADARQIAGEDGIVHRYVIADAAGERQEPDELTRTIKEARDMWGIAAQEQPAQDDALKLISLYDAGTRSPEWSRRARDALAALRDQAAERDKEIARLHKVIETSEHDAECQGDAREFAESRLAEQQGEIERMKKRESLYTDPTCTVFLRPNNEGAEHACVRYKRELAELQHDIARHLAIATDQQGEIERARTLLREVVDEFDCGLIPYAKYKLIADARAFLDANQ